MSMRVGVIALPLLEPIYYSINNWNQPFVADLYNFHAVVILGCHCNLDPVHEIPCCIFPHADPMLTVSILRAPYLKVIAFQGPEDKGDNWHVVKSEILAKANLHCQSFVPQDHILEFTLLETSTRLYGKKHVFCYRQTSHTDEDKTCRIRNALAVINYVSMVQAKYEIGEEDIEVCGYFGLSEEDIPQHVLKKKTLFIYPRNKIT